jgi:hypothetical protein
MKMKLVADNGTPYFILKYEEGDWELLKRKYEELGLLEAETERGYGDEVKLKYFRDPTSVFSNTLRLRGMNITNDINNKFWKDGYVNVAMLRILPDAKGEVKMPLTTYPTIRDIKTIGDTISQVLKASLETLCDMEITIVIKKND